jgi:hypothetical protein
MRKASILADRNNVSREPSSRLLLGRRTTVVCAFQEMITEAASMSSSRFTIINGPTPPSACATRAKYIHPYRDPEMPHYPFHDRTVCVTRCGRLCIGKRKINLSQVFSGQLVGIREVEEKIWLVSFLDFDLGYFDEQEGRVEPGPNPFVAKVLTMS